MVDLADQADGLLTIFDASYVGTTLNTFNDTLQPALDIHAPMKSIKIRSRPCRFVHQEIKNLMKSRFHHTISSHDFIKHGTPLTELNPSCG